MIPVDDKVMQDIVDPQLMLLQSDGSDESDSSSESSDSDSSTSSVPPEVDAVGVAK